MFNINIRTEEELKKAEYNLLPEGEYQLTVKKAEKGITINGYEKLTLWLSTEDNRILFDTLVTMGLKENDNLSEEELKKFHSKQLFLDYKTRKFCEAFGIKYEKDLKPEHWIGLSGKCFVTIQSEKIFENGRIPAKNIIKKYIEKTVDNRQDALFQPSADFDDIPF